MEEQKQSKPLTLYVKQCFKLILVDKGLLLSVVSRSLTLNTGMWPWYRQDPIHTEVQ